MIGKDLINKRIVVFGGSGQIGFALVKYLAGESVSVLVADILKNGAGKCRQCTIH